MLIEDRVMLLDLDSLCILVEDRILLRKLGEMLGKLLALLDKMLR